jgi:hypothetical protein
MHRKLRRRKTTGATIDIEQPWDSAHSAKQCLLNKLSIKDVFDTTVVLDLHPLAGETGPRTKYGRGGRYFRGEPGSVLDT